MMKIWTLFGQEIGRASCRERVSSVALNISEAEYRAACFASYEAIWLRKLMSGLFDMDLDTTVIICDNHSCIKMTENHVFHDKSKNIEI